MDDLQQRFESFVRTLRGFESIDALLKGVHLDQKKRADYLLWDRLIIIEQKVLVADPAEKPQQFVNQLMNQGRVIVYGQVSTDSIFERMPDGEEQKKRMFLQIAKGLEASFAAADKQTRDTREIFSIPQAVGLVVLLNASAPMLYPDVIRYGLSQALMKKRDDGSVRYRHNDGIVVISEAHSTASRKDLGPLCFSATAPHTNSGQLVRDFSEYLLRAWAAFNRIVPMHQSAIGSWGS
jgi:hypothetical protein